METFTFNDILANTKVTCGFPGLNTTVEELDSALSGGVGGGGAGVKGDLSIFFPGCSFINYALPLVKAVYDTLKGSGEVSGMSLLCCGKILSYEQNGEQVRAAFEQQLMDRLAQVGCARLICACPNCVGALRAAFKRDPRMKSVQVETLPEVLVRLGYKVDARTAQAIFARKLAEDKWYSGQITDEPTFMREIENAPAVKFAVHDSCPDRETGEFAKGLRDIMPAGLWVDPAHCKQKSICCGSLPRAAGRIEAADKCARLNGEEALDAGANAIVTPCVSCCFQLHMAQSAVPVFHYLELLYNWAIDWRQVDGLMKLRFLFDDILGAEDKRAFKGLSAPDAP